MTNVQSVKNPVMTLITKAEMVKLLKAGYEGMTPIVKLFGGPITWLVTGIEDGILYGYGDIGQQCVEWGGLISIEELPTLRTGIAYIERDRWFRHVEGTKYLDMESLVGI
jgi:hypothetical protein